MSSPPGCAVSPPRRETPEWWLGVFRFFVLFFGFVFFWCCGSPAWADPPFAIRRRPSAPLPAGPGLAPPPVGWGGWRGWGWAGAGRQVQAGPAPAATARPRAGLVGRRLLQPRAEVSKSQIAGCGPRCKPRGARGLLHAGVQLLWLNGWGRERTLLTFGSAGECKIQGDE